MDVLHRNLRVTDQKAALGHDCYAALLVDTPEMGGRTVLDRINVVTCEAGLEVELTFHCHDDDSFGLDRSQDDQSRSDHRDDSRGNGNKASDLVARPRLAPETMEAQLGVVQFASPPRKDVLPPRSSGEGKPVRLADSRLTPPPASGLMMSVKRAMDIAGSLVGLGVSTPLLGLAAIAIKLDDGGPVFFRQTREGRHGRLFTIYKLRTMVTNADEIKNELRDQSHRDGPAFKVKRDPRVTRVGRFLRATCLDELPQFFNVLRGDMAMVGPRPLIVPESRACTAWQRRRLDVRPGLTCTWQVNKAAAETFDDWMRMDLDYIDRMGLMRDVRLMFRTVAVQLSGRGAD